MSFSTEDAARIALNTPESQVTEAPTAGGSALTEAVDLTSLFELMERGGPMMIPIGLCSILALGFALERFLRTTPGSLGGKRFVKAVVGELRVGGPEAALEMCGQKRHALARILRTGLVRHDQPYLDRDQAMGDAAGTEVERLAANLRPLLIVWLVAPLLGLLGTVWGMIEAFGEIAESGGLGKPELLAAGIYQALTTTAAGLVVAIPAVVAHQLLRGRIDRFARRIEDAQRELEEVLLERSREPQSSGVRRAGEVSA